MKASAADVLEFITALGESARQNEREHRKDKDAIGELISYTTAITCELILTAFDDEHERPKAAPMQTELVQ